MKTRLQEDFDESGSAPAVPPRPAVWQRPAPAPAADTAPLAATAPTPVRAKAHGFAPQPPIFNDGLPPSQDTTAKRPPDATAGGGDPDWLTERLARDAATHERMEWNGRWTRHLATWGAAGVLLALVAGGGLWLVEQRQVEGALVVVANTNQAPPHAAARALPETAAPRVEAAVPAPALAPGLPASAQDTPVTSQRQAPPPMVLAKTSAVGADAVGGTTGPATDAGQDAVSAAPAGNVQAEPEADIAPPKRQRSHVRKRPKVEDGAAAADSEPSGRQRRDETLLQCRAHGYDERQCLQRGCEMTRFGFACKG